MLSLRATLLPDPDWIDFLLQHFDPTLSVRRTWARIESIHTETATMKSFVLRPNGPIPFVAGQSIPVRVEWDGIVHERPYSPISAPGAATLTIAVQRHPEGIVSRWLHDRATVGDRVELGAALGAFVLPAQSAPLLLIAGGSGITAIYALLRAALQARGTADVIVLYYAARPADFAFVSDLRRLARDYRGLHVHFVAQRAKPERAPRQRPTAARFGAAHLAAWAPDYADRQTFVCGPATLMDAVGAHWKDAGLGARLHGEAFAPPAVDTVRASRSAPVHFRRSVRTVEGTQPTLLAIAEAAGLRPASGCRMGICHTCSCTLVSGAVRNRVTGAVESRAGSRIRICVSEPLGPTTLDL